MAENTKISLNISQVKQDIEQLTAQAADINIVESRVGKVRCLVVSAEGLISSQLMTEAVFSPLMRLGTLGLEGPKLFSKLICGCLTTPDANTADTYEELLELVFAGFAAVIVEGVGKAAVFGVQGFEKRTVAPPMNEQTVSAAQDCFVEALRVNLSLIRRRLRTVKLRFDMMTVGELSRTDVCIAYIQGRADNATVERIKASLSRYGQDCVLTGEALQPYLSRSYSSSVFCSVMVTERPDLACLSLSEGKILVIVDGTPFVMLLPTVFADNFRTMDDYCRRPFFAAASKLLRYASFLLAVVFPGLYVALVMFHPEIFTLKLLLNLAAAEEATPYPLTVEMLTLMVLFEIMREAGIRLPKAVGGAVSIVGGLIIGDAAVKSGLISQPLLIVVGITATASFVLPSLYPSVSVLRLVFILAGGTAGLLGIALVGAAVTTNLNCIKDHSVPYTLPLTPFDKEGFKRAAAR